MTETTWDAKTYLAQFELLDAENKITAQLLYEMYLKKFKLQVDADEFQLINEYQMHVFDCVEHMRLLSLDLIKSIFIYFDQTCPCLADIIIMTWCSPRANEYCSKIMYDKAYRKNIDLYNHKLFELADFYVVRNFCIESLGKTNSIPIHCIDIVWYWMGDYKFEFAFSNIHSSHYIGISTIDDYVNLTINMECILDMGLGICVCDRGTFKNVIMQFVTDTQLIDRFRTIETKHNYEQQLKNITKKYLHS